MKHYKVKQENIENENGKTIPITTGKTVRYKHCNGSWIDLILTAFICNSIPEKTIHFGKKGNCNICGVSGIFDVCETRKYIAFKGNTLFKYYIFHVGSNNCVPSDACTRPSKILKKSLSINSNSKPWTIHLSAVLMALRERKSWNEIKDFAAKVGNRKSISNKENQRKESDWSKGKSVESCYLKLWRDWTKHSRFSR